MKLNDLYCAKILAKNGNDDITIVAGLPETFAFDIASQYEAPFAQGMAGDTKIASLLRLGGLSLTNQAMTAQVWQGTSDVQFTLPFVFQADTDEIKDVLEPIKNLMRLALPRTSQQGGILESPGPRIDYEKLIQNAPQATNDILNATAGGATEMATGGMMGGLQAATGNGEQGLQTASKSAKVAKERFNGASVAFSSALKGAITNNISLEIGRYMLFEHVVILDVQQSANVQPLASGIFQRVEVNVTFKTFMLPTANDLDNMFRGR